MIRFLLNNTLQSISDIDPNTTILNYLRTTKSLTGTKEGCASGDCGACTVVLAEVKNDQLTYLAINSCLTLLPALNGKQLITVEALKSGSQLHPVQQSLVDNHGSQCGFCTPGIVMSLFSYSKNAQQEFSKAKALEALSGNLCRCTGYQPIINAAQEINYPKNDWFDQQQQETIDTLKNIQPPQNSPANDALLSKHQHSTTKKAFAPVNLTQLDSLLKQYPSAHLLAGGTDLVLDITQKHQSFDELIYVGGIDELQQVSTHETHIELGAAVSLTQCHTILANEYPDFGHLLERFASLQVRNQGTLGGNIANASPIGDTPPALIAAGASLQLRHAGSVRSMPLEVFFIDYRKTHLAAGEYIEKIIIPRKPKHSLYKVYKLSKRLDDDISAVCGAFHIELSNNKVIRATIAYGGMAAICKRATQCEQELIGHSWDKSSIERAMAALGSDYTPLTDFRASAQYRIHAARNLLLKFWMESQPNSLPTRVTDYV
ncbi:xanthine dehydrogenase small subunit [Neptunomonas sp.]|uniref:xanthine dehydrogenase small subunit n=1 Tax=Neptunomonas sp. TaxID=1971898 RepID=UPI0025D4D231|nr:xanthine dehydrogenase small subunit [Neptunomonas sp.]